MGGVSIVFSARLHFASPLDVLSVLANILGFINCCVAVMTCIFGLTDVDHPIKWRERNDCGNCNPWLTSVLPS